MVLTAQAVAQVAYTNVDYLCANDTWLSNYLRSPLTRREVFVEDEARLFEEFPNDNDTCGFDPATGSLTHGGSFITGVS